jgi:hypothetical protein
MKSASVIVAVIAVAVVIVGAIPGCGGGSSEPSTYITPATHITNTSMTTVVDPDIAPAAIPTLTLALATSLNGTGVVKATTLTKAELLNAFGTRVAMATITAGKAIFPLTGLTTGHYYIRVNSLNQDLVPTRITNVLASTNQFVGTTLRNTVIGPLADPTVRMKTFALGQSQHPVVAYTTGASQTRYAYSILYLKTSPQQFQVRVLGKASLLAKMNADGPHSFATWMMGSSSHGTSNGSCTGCHGNMMSKPATYSGISAGNGWCYKCHYGPTGPSAGMVDPLN